MDFASAREKTVCEINRLRLELAPVLQREGLALMRAILDLDDSDENRVVKESARVRLRLILDLRDLLEGA